METRSEPIAIITSGGGMKCAYSSGALYALGKMLGHNNPDIFVAASGSVAAMYYFLSGQYEDIRNAWTKYLPSPNFISYAPLPSMNINYLIDTVFKSYMPLNVDTFSETTTKYFVPVTDINSGVSEFITNDTWFDPYEVMRAAKAIPILYNGHVRLGGRTYLDGDFSTSIVDLMNKALEQGAERIICITNSTPPSQMAKFFLRAYAKLLHPNLRASFLKDLESGQEIQWPEGLQFVCLSPSFPLPAVIYSRNRREVIETFTMGYDDMMARREDIDTIFS